MKNNDAKKITALGVVIFSFIGIMMCLAIIAILDAGVALLVSKTALPEGFLKIGGVIASGIGLIVSTAFITIKGQLKGIVSAGVLSIGIILVKIVGNSLLDMPGYFNLNGLIGMILVVVFSFVGGIVGSMLKQ